MAEHPQESSAPPPRGARGPVPQRGAHDRGILDKAAGTKSKRTASRLKKRGASSQPAPVRSTPEVNVGPVERVTSTVLGGALLALGIGRRSIAGAARALAGGGLLYRGLRGHCYLYRALGINTAKGRERSEVGAEVHPVELQRSITIGKPASELYRAWREARNLSQLLGHFAEVSAVGPDRQHWKVRGPLGQILEWDSRIVEERPGEFLRWESLEGADLPNEGSVHFRPAPGEWGTEVTLRFCFNPPGGVLGTAAVKLLGVVPDSLASVTLRRFKSLVETGEIPTTYHNPSGRAGSHAHP